jgi:GDP-4-dehydro-6-deoxy-D-mannose reductase
VRDIVRAYWLLFDHSSREVVFNVCASRVFSIREVIRLYEEITGLAVTVTSDADRIRPYDVTLLYGSNDRIRAHAGWEPRIPFRQTLEDVFTYWKAEVGALNATGGSAPSRA